MDDVAEIIDSDKADDVDGARLRIERPAFEQALKDAKAWPEDGGPYSLRCFR